MALNTLKRNYLLPLPFKRLKLNVEQATEVYANKHLLVLNILCVYLLP